MKYIFVTGGVVSSLGKGLAAASIGTLLEHRGLKVLMQKFDLRAEGIPAFVIGGPYGLSDEVRSKARMLLRLSTMTFPHELARVVLMEQLFRSECLRYGVPYHH